MGKLCYIIGPLYNSVVLSSLVIMNTHGGYLGTISPCIRPVTLSYGLSIFSEFFFELGSFRKCTKVPSPVNFINNSIISLTLGMITYVLSTLPVWMRNGIYMYMFPPHLRVLAVLLAFRSVSLCKRYRI